MKIEITTKGIYQVLKFEDDLNVISDLSEMRILIQGYLNQGKCHIAVSFSNASYIYSGALAVLIDCYKKIKNEDGVLCIVEPHSGLLSVFQILHIDKFIPIYSCLDDLIVENAVM